MINETAIVIAVHDNAWEIERNLPKYLEQVCDAKFKVIVVDDNSTDDTPDILKRMQLDYPNLYTTFLPASSHRKRRRLALTLGAKAADCDWVALADIDYVPENEEWLSRLLQIAEENGGVKLVVGTCKRRRASLWKRYRKWCKTIKLKRKVKSREKFKLPINNALVSKELIVRKGELYASCEYSVWANDARLLK